MQISIILPTYNVEKYIARALDSCIHQSFKDIQIIIVDDCGKDRSIDIAKQYASRDKRIKIIHNKENLGLLDARYKGVSELGGGYIIFLDPDDYLELNACEECVKILDKNHDIDLICFDFIYIHKNHLITKDTKLKDKIYDIDGYCTYIASIDHIKWNLCSKIIKTSVYMKAFSYLSEQNIKITMAEDALLYFFILLHCKKIQTSSKHVYYYCCNNDENCVNTNNITKIEKNLDDEQQVIDILSSFLRSDISVNIYIVLKIMIMQLRIYQLERKIKRDKLRYCYLIYKCRKIVNKVLLKYYVLKKSLILKKYRSINVQCSP